VYPSLTAEKGWGLMAGHSIAAGQLVIEYCGEVFSVESEIGIDRLEQNK
jgi:SET domain-containing protein